MTALTSAHQASSRSARFLTLSGFAVDRSCCSRIVAQVVQLASLVFVPFDQFPVAVSNEPAGALPWLP